MDLPHHLLYRLAGSPPVGEATMTGERCRICGDLADGVPYDRWQGANFTDQNKARYPSGAVVCAACVWTHAWHPPPGYVLDLAGAAAAKAARGEAASANPRGPNMVLFSHFWCERDGYWFGNKADKVRIRAWLLETRPSRWFAAIADSGKKHVLPMTPLNPSGGRLVRFEERTLAIPGSAAEVVAGLCELLTLGPTKEEIGRGEYSAQSWMTAEDEILGFEKLWRGLRGSSWWDLALWLSQRDEERHAALAAARRGNARGSAAAGARGARSPNSGGARRVSRRGGEPAQTLGSDPGPNAGGGADVARAPGLGDGIRAGIEPFRPEQGTLFGDP